MLPAKKREVIELLKQMPAPGNLKRAWLLGWAITVGVRVRANEYREVDASGVG